MRITQIRSDGRVLELTASIYNTNGNAFFITPVNLASNASFSTFFSFRLSQGGGQADVDGVVGADGIVFVVQTVTNNVGGKGGGIGYLGITNSVGVEFDTWWNNGKDNDFYTYPTTDPLLPNGQTNANGSTGDGNHIGIDYNGFLTNTLSGLETNNTEGPYIHITPAMNNGNIWYGWIDYNGANSNLEVRVSTNSIRPLAPTLTNVVNLLDYLHTTNAYLGFTAGTGGDCNQQDILSWQFISPYHPIGSTNPVPSVAITSPTNNAIYIYGPPIALQATASEQGGTITNVQFFNKTNLLGTAVVGANNTYAFAWTNAFEGSNALTAVATDNYGLSCDFGPGGICHYGRSAPGVRRSQSSHQLVWSRGDCEFEWQCFRRRAAIRVTNILWSVVSSNGTVVFSNAALAGTAATFTNDGTYVLQLSVDDGFATNISACTITVLRRPNISIILPTNNAVVMSNTTIALNAVAYDLDGCVTNVQFFDGGKLLGNAVLSANNIYALAWTTTNVLLGTNTLTAVATDTHGFNTTFTSSQRFACYARCRVYYAGKSGCLSGRDCKLYGDTFGQWPVWLCVDRKRRFVVRADKQRVDDHKRHSRQRRDLHCGGDRTV